MFRNGDACRVHILGSKARTRLVKGSSIPCHAGGVDCCSWLLEPYCFLLLTPAILYECSTSEVTLLVYAALTASHALATQFRALPLNCVTKQRQSSSIALEDVSSRQKSLGDRPAVACAKRRYFWWVSGTVISELTRDSAKNIFAHIPHPASWHDDHGAVRRRG